MKKNIIILIVVILLVVAYYFSIRNSDENKIKNKLIDTEISYVGEDIKEYFFKIKRENIINVEIVQCGYVSYKLVEDDCYRVGIGEKEGEIMWYIYFDKNTLEQVKKEQQFVT